MLAYLRRRRALRIADRERMARVESQLRAVYMATGKLIEAMQQNSCAIDGMRGAIAYNANMLDALREWFASQAEAIPGERDNRSMRGKRPN